MTRSWIACTLLLVACCGVSADRAMAGDDWRFDGVSRVVAVSDVHGAHDAFVSTLQSASIVDDGLAWAGGSSHLVVTGDLLDRGADSRPVMDLLMRLEQEAADAGGQVHVLLGNHEVMNLVGDLRYVAPGEYAAFAADETAAERDRWFDRFAARAEAGTDPATLREQFERAHPPGFFAHRRAFRADGTYGRWLLGKPLVVVINRSAFVHGGLSPMAERLGLDGLNRGMGEELEAYVRALAVLTEAGLLLPGDGFYAHAAILGKPGETLSPSPDVAAAIATVLNPPEASIHHLDGPLWYRGQVGCPAIVEQGRLVPALAALEADRVVVGHTPTAARSVVSRLDGRIIEIDTGMLSNYYKGSGHALEIRGDTIAVHDESGATVPVVPDQRPAGGGAHSRERLEALLANSDVTLGESVADNVLAARVSDGSVAVDAVFYPQRSRKASPEVAAYRLDRLLGLELVPVTVSREVEGRAGALQLRPARLVNEAQRAENRAGGDAWCPLPAQWAAMYLFDALAYTPPRGPAQIQYDGANWRLYLTGHAGAFEPRRGRPAWLDDIQLDVNDAWRNALHGLDQAAIDEAFGDVLDKRRRRALLARRDALLAD